MTERSRQDVEAELPIAESAYRTAPGVKDNRRAYANVLFELGNIWQANTYIVSKLPEQTQGQGPKIIMLDNTAPYVGFYEVAPGVYLEISAKGGILMLHAPGQGTIGITAYDDGAFSIPLASVILKFEGDPAHAITVLAMVQRQTTTYAVKK